MKKVVVLGAAGFIGREVVRAAREQGFEVHALVRSEAQSNELRTLGALPFLGDVRNSEQLTAELAGADAVLDLIQPPLPPRLTSSVIRRVAAERASATSSLLTAL